MIRRLDGKSTVRFSKFPSLVVVGFGGLVLLIIFNAGCDNEEKYKDKSRDTEEEDNYVETDSLSIGDEALYKGADSAHPYHACKEAVATGEAPLISDFENGTVEILANEGRSGGWYTDDDNSGGTLSVDVDAGALHIIAKGWTDWGAGVIAVIAPSPSDNEHCFYDASYYIGVRFRARGKGKIQLKVGSVANYPVALGGVCNRNGNNCYDRPMGQVKLTDEWQTFEFPYCVLKSQGWGGEIMPLNPAEIIDLFFMLPAGQDKEVWIDEVAFFTSESATKRISCEDACPMALVSYLETIVPEASYLTLTDELTLHTFDQETTSCGVIRRRYLSYVPGDVTEESNAPVLIALHGTSGNAEAFQSSVSHGRLDELAARDGVIVVYGNAAPGFYSSDNPQRFNTGSWRQAHYDDGEVDDVDYLQMVLADLKVRNVISGDNDIYLVGFSSGGGMVLSAARERPEMFRGIAPFMAFDGWDPSPVPDLRDARLERVLFVYTSDDPRLPDGYGDVLSTLPAEWATSMGLPENVTRTPTETALPNLVSEGEAYTGDDPLALRTRNSSGMQIDFTAPDVSGSVRVLAFDHAGHYWPTPRQNDTAEFVAVYGFTNQDMDASDAVWAYFMSFESSD